MIFPDNPLKCFVILESGSFSTAVCGWGEWGQRPDGYSELNCWFMARLDLRLCL